MGNWSNYRGTGWWGIGSTIEVRYWLVGIGPTIEVLVGGNWSNYRGTG